MRELSLPSGRGTFSSEQVREFVSHPRFDPKVIGARDAAFPRISVVVPSYNQAMFLERTILSILNQNYPNMEIMVYDGGSQDGSVEIIKKYERYLASWVSEPDKGQPSVINKGFERASGEIIGWQNSDDLYLPGFFHAVAQSFGRHADTQLFIGNVYLIDHNDRITWASNYGPFSVEHLIYLGWNLSSQGTFVRRRVFEKVGPLREDIQVGFDWDWFIRVGKAVRHTVLHRTYGGCYRIHAAAKISTFEPEARWKIDQQILRSHRVCVQAMLPYERQSWWQTKLMKLRRRLYEIVLYSPRPVLRRLRPLSVWCLARMGVICEGFDRP